MSDTQYKSKSLAGLDPAYPALGSLVANTLMRWSPWAAVMRAQDTIPATARRVLGEWHISGATTWQQGDGSDDPGTTEAPVPLQVYPEEDEWRTIATFRSHVTPGCELRARVLYCPAGLTQRTVTPVGGSEWASSGAWADFRVRVTWANGVSSSGPHDWSLTMPGAVGGTYGGLEPQGAGAAWASLSEAELTQIRPPDFTTDPAIAATYSEWSDVLVALAVRGGSRIVHAVVYEYPLGHTTEHDDDGLTSVHAMPAGGVPLTPYPMLKAPDGATYEEHRHGTRRVAQVAERQSERLGPRILQWTSWTEDEADLYQQAEQSPISVTSATFVELGSADDVTPISAYSVDGPGWIVAGAHAKLARLCEPNLISRGGFGVVPVRVRVDAGNSGTGVLRVQSGLYEWIDVSLTGGRGTYTATGHLQSQAHGDHDAPPVMIFVRASAGTVDIYNVSVDFGTWA